jgi:hypothetical protein
MRQMDGQQPLEQAGIILGGVDGVYGPQNTTMLWQCIITIIFAGGGHGCGGCDTSCVCSMATEKCNKNTKIRCL